MAHAGLAARGDGNGMEQLGDYLVHRLIGEGGMGKVYEAVERLSKRKVALKVLHQELARSDEGRRLFLNEMQILAHLEHPNIVRSLASTEVGGELVMVLEYLDGRTLRSVLGDGRLPWQEAVRIVSSVASALSAAHGQEPPIIHRDLKPENIMVLEGGAVKVMDFGIAKVIQAMSQTNTQSVGTLQYMSPEQIDAHTIDHRSDLYCLGLVFYELLTGHAPFQSASPRQLLNMQCTAEPPPLSDDVRSGLPKGVEALVFQLLEKAPEDRPYLASDVVERLEPFEPAGRPASPRGAARAGAAATTTPHRTPNQKTPATAPDASAAATPSRALTPAERPSAAGAKTPAPQGRADTIALVDQVDRARNVPTAVAIGIIVALSALAGIGAYTLRSSGSADQPPGGPSAEIPNGPAQQGNR
jgi:eukaryotic-like serine/threonine-protein kinase